MNEQQIEMITNYLDKIGEKIGQGTNTIWPWMVKQQYVHAFVYLSSCIIFGVITSWLYRKWVNQWADEWTCDDNPCNVFRRSVGAFASTLVWIGLIVAIIGFFTEFFDIFNPEYWALKDLLKMVQQ